MIARVPAASLHGRTWQWLFVRARILAAATAAGLLALRPNAEGDLVLAIAAIVWGGLTAAGVQRWPWVMSRPWAWVADLGVCLMLVVISGQWRSPCYLLAVTALIAPGTALPPRTAMGLGVAFAATYFVLALRLGIEWQVLASTARSESFATHLLIPLLVVAGLAHATRLLDQLDAERERTEALALEGERRRIAWELHDSAKQRIHAAQLVLSAVTPGVDAADAERLRFAQGELDGSTADLDASLAELRTTLGGLRLDEALTRRAQELERVSGVRIAVHGRAPSLPTFAAVHAYRVACEAINNAIRHADAGRIDVVLENRAKTVRLAVQDDGRGIGDALPSTGLESMQARAQQLGARLRISEGEPRGTLVELELPRRPADSAQVPAW